jgi:hypothetical protein
MTAKRIQVYGLTAKQYYRLKAQADNLGLDSVSEYAKMGNIAVTCLHVLTAESTSMSRQ